MTAPTKYEIELLARARARVARSKVRYIAKGEENIAYPADCNLILDLIGQIESLRCALGAASRVS